MLATYSMEFGQGRHLAVKNVFVPLWVSGRRWGNFELAYRDEVDAGVQLRRRPVRDSTRQRLGSRRADAPSPPWRRLMNASRSNSITSCSFLSSAPWSGGIALAGSLRLQHVERHVLVEQQLQPVEQFAGRRLLLEARDLADLVEDVHRLRRPGSSGCRGSGRRRSPASSRGRGI